LLYKLPKLKFLLSLIKLISSFLSQRKFIALVESEMSMPCGIQAGVLPGSILYPILYNIYIHTHTQCMYVCLNHMFQVADACLGLFADDTCIYVTEGKGGYVLRRLQQGLSTTEMWCEC
jgi:hypothetical protein